MEERGWEGGSAPLQRAAANASSLPSQDTSALVSILDHAVEFSPLRSGIVTPS